MNDVEEEALTRYMGIGKALVRAGLGAGGVLLGLAARNRLQESRAERSYPPPGKFISLNGELIHYLDKGSGLPVILLPGSSGSTMDFELFYDELATRYRVISLDRPGQAWSPRLTGKNYHLSGYAYLLHDFLQSIGVGEPVLLFGHSYGGGWALAYALRFPQDVRGLILSGPTAWEREHLGDRSRDRIPFLKLPFAGKAVGGEMAPIFISAFLRWEMSQVPKRSIDPMPSSYISRVSNIWSRPAHMWTVWDEMTTMDKDLAAQEQQYGEITVPVIVMSGDQDPTVSLQSSIDLHNALPNSRLVVLENSGHHPNYSHPNIVIDLIDHMAAVTRGEMPLNAEIPALNSVERIMPPGNAGITAGHAQVYEMDEQAGA